MIIPHISQNFIYLSQKHYQLGVMFLKNIYINEDLPV